MPENRKVYQRLIAYRKLCHFFVNLLLTVKCIWICYNKDLSFIISIYFEDPPRRSIEYFRIHQETLRRGGQEIIQNIWSWWCQLFWRNVLINIAAHQDVSIPIYFEDPPRRSIEYFRIHLLIVELLFFQAWQWEDTLRTNPFLSRGMLGVPVVEWLNVVSV